MKDAYCASCKKRVNTKMLPYGESGLVEVCARCETGGIFDHIQEWIEHEHNRVMRIVECADPERGHDDKHGHTFEDGRHRRSKRGQCDYCQIPEDHPLAEYSEQKY